MKRAILVLAGAMLLFAGCRPTTEGPRAAAPAPVELTAPAGGARVEMEWVAARQKA